MTGSRTAVIVATGARLVVGAAVAAGCVIGVAAAVIAPWPGVAGTAAELQVASVPSNAVLSCASSIHALGRDAGQASSLQTAGVTRITAGGAPDDPERSVLDTPDLAGSEGASVFTGRAQGRDVPLAAAAESRSLNVDDLAGLAASACAEAATDSWIVGGSTRTGASDVLILANPAAVPATVTLAVYGSEQSASQIVVPPATQKAVPFASVAATQDAPIVRVSAEGAPVRAALQSALTSVLDPAGIDLQSATTVTGEQLTFSGVRLLAPDEGSATGVIRLLAPDADTEARVVVRDQSGAVAGEFTAPLVAGVPLEAALSDVSNGVYSVEVTADTRLVAGVWQSTGIGRGSDFAWMLPAPAIEADTLVAVPSGPEAGLHLVADADRDVSVTLTDSKGAERVVTVAAGESEMVRVRNSAVYRISTDAPLRAAVTMMAKGQLAGWPVVPGAAEPRSFTVVP